MLSAIDALASSSGSASGPGSGRAASSRAAPSRNPFLGALGTLLRPTRDPNALEQLNAYRGWVYKAVNVIANRVAQIDFQLVEVRLQRDGREERTPIPLHPLYDVLGRGGHRAPNPHVTSFNFRKLSQLDLSLTGNAFWVKVRDASRATARGGIPRELWRARPDRMLPIINKETGIIEGWGFIPVAGGHAVTWAAADVVHFRYPHPTDPYLGFSPIMAHTHAINIDVFNHIYQQKFFEQGALSTIVLSSQSDITTEDAKEMLEVFKQRHTGAKNAWLPIVLGGGAQVTPISMKNTDLQAIELMEWSEEEILSIWGVSKTQVGLAGDVNLSNAHALDVAFNKNVIVPELTNLEEQLEKDLIPDYPARGEDAWLEVDFENPVPGDREAELEEDRVLVSMGARTINEVRSRRGELPFTGPFGDAVQIPFSAVLHDPASPELPNMDGGAADPDAAAEPDDDPDDDPEEDPEDEPRAVAAWVREQRAPSEEERTAFWWAWARRAARWEPRLAAILRGEFARQQAAVLKALRAQTAGRSITRQSPIDVDRLIREGLDGSDAAMLEAARAILQRLIQREGRAALGLLTGDGGAFDWKATAIRYLLSTLPRFRHVAHTTEDAVRVALAEGLAAGEGVPKLAKRVRAVFADAGARRAMVIARTEVIGASNAAAEAGYRQGGAEKKGWLATRDSRTRDAHAAADGQVVAITAHFQVGGEALLHPGDPTGSASNTVQCRCTIEPR